MTPEEVPGRLYGLAWRRFDIACAEAGRFTMPGQSQPAIDLEKALRTALADVLAEHERLLREQFARHFDHLARTERDLGNTGIAQVGEGVVREHAFLDAASMIREPSEPGCCSAARAEAEAYGARAKALADAGLGFLPAGGHV